METIMHAMLPLYLVCHLYLCFWLIFLKYIFCHMDISLHGQCAIYFYAYGNKKLHVLFGQIYVLSIFLFITLSKILLDYALITCTVSSQQIMLLFSLLCFSSPGP